MVGEALYAMRGLLYVLMLRSRSTSLPVLLSLVIALVSRTLLRAERKREGQGRGVVGGLEKEEFARRDRALGGLLFRGVLWEGFTKCVLFAFLSHSQLPLRRPNETIPRCYFLCARFLEQQTGSRECGSKDAADPAGRSRRRPSVGLRPPNRRVLLLHRDLRHHTFFLAFVSLSFMMLAFPSCVVLASEVQDRKRTGRLSFLSFSFRVEGRYTIDRTNRHGSSNKTSLHSLHERLEFVLLENLEPTRLRHLKNASPQPDHVEERQ